MPTKIWNDFCDDVMSSKKKKSKEKDFEKGPVKDFLTSLGWVRYGSHRLVEQHPIQFATANHFADFALFLQDEDKPEMIIELKRPTKKKEDKDAVQLEDYMIKEECRFGLLVGEVLELYFIDFSRPKHRAELISTITFDKDNDDAGHLISLLLAQNYDTDKMYGHCSQQMKLNDAVKSWNSQEGRDKLITYILKSSSLPESLKNKLQSMIKIEVKILQPKQISEKAGETPQSVVTTTSNDFHAFRLKMKGADASIRYYPSEHRYVIMSHSLIRKKGTASFRNQAAAAKRNEVISDKTWSRDLGESIELLRDVEFVADAPNTPTQFCTARSTNATEALIDEEGKRFADVFPKGKDPKPVDSNMKPQSPLVLENGIVLVGLPKFSAKDLSGYPTVFISLQTGGQVMCSVLPKYTNRATERNIGIPTEERRLLLTARTNTTYSDVATRRQLSFCPYLR